MRFVYRCKYKHKHKHNSKTRANGYSSIQSPPRTSDNYQFDYTVVNISQSRPIRLITESIRVVSILNTLPNPNIVDLDIDEASKKGTKK